MKKKTFVSLIGAGPGNPEFLTLKGLKELQQADVILYDALLEHSFQEYFPANSIKVYVGKRCGKHSHHQKEITELMIRYAKEGHHVVRLKGGDPFLFGRGWEEVEVLIQENIPFEIIPGVSSVHAGSSLFNIPLTHRGLSKQVLILDGHDILNLADFDWKSFTSFSGTIVILMGTLFIQEIANRMLYHGSEESMPIALVENASFENQSVTISDLQNVKEFGFKKKTNGAGIIYIGEVINLYYSNLK